MGMSNPLVSVIIPNYNYARTLSMCLRAVAEQTYPAIETIVVDDGSTDESVAIAESFGVQVMKTPSNGGCGTARNLAASRAEGEILFFLDSDVALYPDAVANAVKLLRDNPQVSVVCGMYDDRPLIPSGLVKEYRCLQQHHWFAESQGRMRGFNPALCAIRAEVFRSVGPFNPRHRQTEEQDYAYRLAVSGHEVHGSSAVMGRHDHDDGLRTLLRKVFHRTRLAIPLYARWKGLPGGAATGPRALAAILALLAAVSAVAASVLVPLAPLTPGWRAAVLAVPLALFAASILADLGMYRAVARARGAAMVAIFSGLHFLVNLAVATGAAAGAIQLIGSRRFRLSYSRGPGPGHTIVIGRSVREETYGPGR